MPIHGEVGAGRQNRRQFSVGYIVEKAGKQAFMKVFDIANAFAAPPERIAFELQRISSAYLHEKGPLGVVQHCQTGPHRAGVG